MKIKLKIATLLIILLLIYSCDDSVTFKSDLEKKYSVNLILRGDTTLQTAYVSSNYDVDGFNPDSLKTDPFVDNAVFSIKYNETSQQYYFRDTTDNTKINSRFNSASQYYYLNNFIPKSNSEIELEILFNDNQMITGKTFVPNAVKIDEYNTARFIPGFSKEEDTLYYKIAWENSDINLLKVVAIKFPYVHRNFDGTITSSVKQVPLYYVINGSDTTIKYIATTYQNYFLLSRKYLSNALKAISIGDEHKGRYSVFPLQIEIFALDENLTKFYSAELYFNYGFTVTNFQADLSNVEGGYGFLGSYSYTTHSIKFDEDYIFDNFGYLTE